MTVQPAISVFTIKSTAGSVESSTVHSSGLKTKTYPCAVSCVAVSASSGTAIGVPGVGEIVTFGLVVGGSVADCVCSAVGGYWVT